MGLSVLSTAAALGLVFASSPMMSKQWATGGLRLNGWLCLFGAGTLGNVLGGYVGRNAFGEPAAYRNHWMAYSYVKGCNRWEGR